LRWIITDDNAFTSLENQSLKAMLYYLQPVLDKRGYLPTHITIQKWIQSGYQTALPFIQKLLDESISKMHVSFDIWSSRTMTGFCAIHVHFYGSNGY